jgi:hypothetical protein
MNEINLFDLGISVRVLSYVLVLGGVFILLGLVLIRNVRTEKELVELQQRFDELDIDHQLTIKEVNSLRSEDHRKSTIYDRQVALFTRQNQQLLDDLTKQRSVLNHSDEYKNVSYSILFNFFTDMKELLWAGALDVALHQPDRYLDTVTKLFNLKALYENTALKLRDELRGSDIPKINIIGEVAETGELSTADKEAMLRNLLISKPVYGKLHLTNPSDED